MRTEKLLKTNITCITFCGGVKFNFIKTTIHSSLVNILRW